MKRTLLSLLFFAYMTQASAQGPAQNKSKFIRSLQRVVWTAGISGVVIDDDAKPFKDVFNVKNTWDFLPYPTKLNVEGYIDHGISVEGAFTYAKLHKGKLIDEINRPRTADVTLIAFDVNVKYDLNQLIGDTKSFSPYVIGGLGYTRRSLSERQTAITGNIGFGFNIWIYKGFGLNVQSMAKFALNNAASKNYLQHSVGAVYRFNLLTGYKTPGRLGHRYNLFRND